MSWQPIESCPKTGTYLLSSPVRKLGRSDEYVSVITIGWFGSHGKWRQPCGHDVIGQPNRWMPIPDPPKE